MTPERWREIERLFHAASERAENERHDFLAGACGADEELRGEVEELLAQSGSRWSVLDRPAMAAAPSPMNRPAMTSMIGRRIHTYELVGVLGAGGMGQVYRARDSRLGRDVAIKILPSAYKTEPERIARFQREAQVLAALKHPHIGAIYGLEETPELTALVMELVEGEDLANRLARGPLAPHDALTIARQIADALDAAHELGIIHRDLKPANICLQRDGTVKVVDFGLAKPLLQVDTAPTLTVISHAGGAVIGTPAYMSPEQARGEAAGREADIWAFGVVLYEMLTGRSPFSCPTTAETLARVLSAPVDEGLLPVDTPESIRRLIRRCLAKDPRRRVRHMGDVRNELRRGSFGIVHGRGVCPASTFARERGRVTSRPRMGGGDAGPRRVGPRLHRVRDARRRISGRSSPADGAAGRDALRECAGRVARWPPAGVRGGSQLRR